MGRLVLTHSTYIDGLISWGKTVAKNKSIKTLTPGVIGKTRGSRSKLEIRITRKTLGGYKLVARKGSMYQEIYVITGLSEEDLKKVIMT